MYAEGCIVGKWAQCSNLHFDENVRIGAVNSEFGASAAAAHICAGGARFI
jgi:hypothetical protein